MSGHEPKPAPGHQPGVNERAGKPPEPNAGSKADPLVGAMPRGADPSAYASVIASQPGSANAVFAELQRSFGNGFVQQVMNAIDAQHGGGTAPNAVSADAMQPAAPAFAPVADAAPTRSSPAAARELALSRMGVAVQVAEHEVAGLQSDPDRLERALAPDAVIGDAVGRVVSALTAVPMLIQQANPDGSLTPALAPFLARLDNAISALQILAKRYKARQRESRLERLFDLEDSILQGAGKPTLKRAAAYYSDDALEVSASGPTPEADTIKKGLVDDKEAPPTSRDALLRSVQSLASKLTEALDNGFDEAERTLHEPTKAKHDALAGLAEFAADMLLGNVKFILGRLARLGLRHTPIPTDLHDSLGEGFREAGKNAAKSAVPKLKGPQGSRQNAKPGDTDIGDSALSPKTIYLNAAARKTGEAMARTRQRFDEKASTFERLPNETLLAMLDGVDIPTFIDAYRHLIVQEWVNFGKLAADQGVDMRDPALKDGSPSRLDAVIRPYGVVAIKLQIDAQGNPTFRSAALPGVGSAVVDDLRQSGKSLGSMSVHRRIEIVGATEHDVGAGSFDVSPSGEITPASALGERSRLVLARVLGRNSAQATDADARSGMHALLTWLHGVGCDRITDNG